MVPVSVRRRASAASTTTASRPCSPGCPVGLARPGRAPAGDPRRDGRDQGVQAGGRRRRLTSLSGFAPPLLLALGSRLVTRSPRLNMHTATTNVPGPQQPVQTLGRRMLESYPFVPVVGPIRIVVAIFSYDGGLYFGVTGDYDGRGHRRAHRRNRGRARRSARGRGGVAGVIASAAHPSAAPCACVCGRRTGLIGREGPRGRASRPRSQLGRGSTVFVRTGYPVPGNPAPNVCASSRDGTGFPKGIRRIDIRSA